MFGYDHEHHAAEAEGGEGARHGRHHRHGQHGRGFGREPGFGFGGFGPFGPGPRGRGRKARRGDIRTAALLLLAEEPRNGYQIMQEVQERSGGVWRPSPGSVYPALAQLEDEGLIRTQDSDGRKSYAITDAGRERLDERDAQAPAPWEQMSDSYGDDVRQLAEMMREVAFAFSQVARAGSDTQLAKAREILTVARRDLYRLLADGDEGSATVDQTSEA